MRRKSAGGSAESALSPGAVISKGQAREIVKGKYGERSFVDISYCQYLDGGEVCTGFPAHGKTCKGGLEVFQVGRLVTVAGRVIAICEGWGNNWREAIANCDLEPGQTLIVDRYGEANAVVYPGPNSWRNKEWRVKGQVTGTALGRIKLVQIYKRNRDK